MFSDWTNNSRRRSRSKTAPSRSLEQSHHEERSSKRSHSTLIVVKQSNDVSCSSMENVPVHSDDKKKSSDSFAIPTLREEVDSRIKSADTSNQETEKTEPRPICTYKSCDVLPKTDAPGSEKETNNQRTSVDNNSQESGLDPSKDDEAMLSLLSEIDFAISGTNTQTLTEKPRKSSNPNSSSKEECKRPSRNERKFSFTRKESASSKGDLDLLKIFSI